MPSSVDVSPRTTYFLGAGASAAVCDRPVVTNKLLAIALEVKPRPGMLRHWDLASELVNFLAAKGEEPTIDEVLSLIDLCLSERLPLSSRWPIDRLADARKSLNYLIYDCIQTSIHEKEPAPDNPLETLLRECGKESGTSIITLNWDCLVERTHMRLRGQREGVIDYGVECVKANGGCFEIDPGALLVLKPHGSLSWGHCPLCSAVVADLVKPFDFSDERPCPRCAGVTLQLVLVPPVPFVRLWPSFLASVWSRVEQVIYESDRLVFIGYSFPPQDIGVRAHLVRALARRQCEGRGPERIEVVTKIETDRQEAANDIRHRYLSMLGGLLMPESLVLHKCGFLEWVGNIGS